MSKYSEFMAFLEFMDKRKKADETTPRPKQSPSPIEIINKKRREAKELDDFFKEMEKVNKKEEKKKSSFEQLTVPQLTMIMVLFVPIYVVMLMKMFL